MFSPKMTTTCLMAAEAVVGVTTTGGVVLLLPLPGGVLTVPWPQPLRMRVKDIERARNFLIIFFEASEDGKMLCPLFLGFDMAVYVNRSLTPDELIGTQHGNRPLMGPGGVETG